MAALERPDPALVALEPPALTPTHAARREGPPAQLIPPGELALADFARHLSLSARQRTAGAYLDALQRLGAFEPDPPRADRGDLERFLSRGPPSLLGAPGGRPPRLDPPPDPARPPPFLPPG